MPGKVAIIVEWENARLSELDRAERMLRQLNVQATAYARSHNTRFELLVIYNSEDIAAEIPTGAVERCIDRAAWPGELRVLPAPGQHYFEQKNFGATQTDASHVLFIDSDVVPEDGWLEKLVEAADTPGTMVIGGQTYMAQETFLDRVFSTFWFFEPKRVDRKGVYDGGGFYANNVMFDRDYFIARPFPAAEAYRGQCMALIRDIKAEGGKVKRHREAFVSHPAPDGLMNSVQRAICQGHDNVYWMRAQRRSLAEISPLGGLLRFIKGISRVFRRVPVRSRQQGIDFGTAAFSVVFGLGYAVVVYASEIVAFVAPGVIRRHVRM